MPDPLTSNQQFLNRLTEIILANLEDENFGVKELAAQSAISRYRLSRNLQAISKKTVSQFIRDVRLQKALEILREEDLTASEVAYRVGFSSPTYFNTCFHELFGYPPGKVKKISPETSDTGTLTEVEDNQAPITPERGGFARALPVILILIVLLGTIALKYYSNNHVSGWFEDLFSPDRRISIAVMPFQNMTDDTTWNIWQYGIQECLISALSNNKNLKVRQKEDINSLLHIYELTKNASVSPGFAGEISQKLDAKFFVSGSIKKAGATIRIDVQIMDTKTKEVCKSIVTSGSSAEANVFQLIDTLSQRLNNYLLISELTKEFAIYQHNPNPHTTSPEAYRYTIYGDDAASKLDNARAISWYLKALEADSNYFDPMIGLSSVYARDGNQEENYKWVLRYYNKRNHFAIDEQLWASWAYAFSFEPPEKGINYLMQLQQLDDQSPGPYYMLGITYNQLGQYDKAIPVLEKNLSICEKWGKDFMQNNSAYTELGLAYHKTGQFRKEKKLYRLSEKYIPDDGPRIMRQAILAFAENDTAQANRYIEMLISVHHKRYESPEANIDRNLAMLYAGAGLLDKAEEYFRKSLSLEPANPDRMVILANFLIENNRKLDEVSPLMDKAMALAKNRYDYYNYLDTKGWSLYKQGKYSEALEILEKTWKEAPFRIYTIQSHFDEVKKAIGESHT